MVGPWLYVVLIGLVIVTYAWLIPKTSTRRQTHSLKEFEESIDSFAAGIDEENQMIINLMQEIRSESSKKIEEGESRISNLENQIDDLKRLLQELQTRQPETFVPAREEPSVETTETIETDQIPVAQVESAEDTEPFVRESEQAEEKGEEPSKPDIRLRYHEIFNLYEQGKGIEYISKKLGMSKGEVLLIIQLSKQEEAFRVQS